MISLLQERGLARTDCTGTTLRAHLGLPRPEAPATKVPTKGVERRFGGPPMRRPITSYQIRTARPEECAAVGRLTYEGFGHTAPGADQPDPNRLHLLLDAYSRAASGTPLVAKDPSYR